MIIERKKTPYYEPMYKSLRNGGAERNGQTNTTGYKTYVFYGKTYAHRDWLKQIGARWDRLRKVWVVSAASPPELPDEKIKCVVRGEHKEQCDQCGREYDIPGFIQPKKGCIYCV